MEITKKALRVPSGKNTLVGEVLLPEEKEGAPLLIYSHGLADSRPEISLRSLAKKGIATCSFDYPGSCEGSRSGGDSTDISVLSLTKDLEAVMDYCLSQEDIPSRDIYLVGHSQGGYVSTITGIKRQQEIRGLFLLSPAYIISDFQSYFFLGGSIPPIFPFFDMTLGRRYVTDMQGYDVYGQMKSFEKPVWIFHGTRDELSPLEYSERAQKTFPHAQLERFSGAGHLLSNFGCSPRIEEIICQAVL